MVTGGGEIRTPGGSNQESLTRHLNLQDLHHEMCHGSSGSPSDEFWQVVRLSKRTLCDFRPLTLDGISDVPMSDSRGLSSPLSFTSPTPTRKQKYQRRGTVHVDGVEGPWRFPDITPIRNVDDVVLCSTRCPHPNYPSEPKRPSLDPFLYSSSLNFPFWSSNDLTSQ